MPGFSKQGIPISVQPFLSDNEPDPVELVAGRDDCAFLITCDHAGRLFPASCNELGLNAAQTREHIAWDPGAEGVARELAGLLGAPLLLQKYSRLLIDCNRPPQAESSIPEISETTTIPGNLQLDDGQRQARREAIFTPYHHAIARQLDRRTEQNLRTLLVSVHSFTPVFKGEKRKLDIGILFNRDPRLGLLLLDMLAGEADIYSAANEPYAVSEQTDYTIPVHCERRGIPHVMLEIKNTLIASQAQQTEWAGRFAAWLLAAGQQLETDGAV